MSVFANGLSIIHQGDGMTHTCPIPDVCKTPSPAGPVPIPYVNVAMSINLADGSTTVKIMGFPVALESSSVSLSSGDEAGTAGGVISSKNMGKLSWSTSSPNVKFEGKGVVRFTDADLRSGDWRFERQRSNALPRQSDPRVAHGSDCAEDSEPAPHADV